MNEEKIQDYVMGTLPAGEVTAVAAAIAKDPELAKLAEQHSIILSALRQQRAQRIAEELNTLEEQLPPPPSSPPKGGGNLRWILSIALLLIVLAGGAAYQSAQFTDAALAERYFELPLDPRIAGTTEDEAAYYLAIESFFAGDYAEAQAGFSSLRESEFYATEARFYLAHAAHLNGDFTEADAAFAATIADPNLLPENLQVAQWNEMINDLRRGEDVSESIRQFSSTAFQLEALQEDLSSWWR